uniref:Uncharacterized protein n=1 Tax=Mustela putorius furo TaxID=9669 RepID=M3Z2K5_MUSPF
MSQGACPQGHGPRPLSPGPNTKEVCIGLLGSSPLFNQWLASGLLLQGPAWNKCHRGLGSSPRHSEGGHPPHLQAAAPQVTAGTALLALPAARKHGCPSSAASPSSSTLARCAM